MSQLVSAAPLFILNVSAGSESHRATVLVLKSDPIAQTQISEHFWKVKESEHSQVIKSYSIYVCVFFLKWLSKMQKKRIELLGAVK